MVRKMRTCSPCFSLVWKPTMFHKRAERIVLAQLDDGIGPAAGGMFGRGGVRIVEPDALHRAVAQRFDAALGHHLDRHAAFEIGRVLLPFLELGLLAGVQRGDEGVVLLAGPSGS